MTDQEKRLWTRRRGDSLRWVIFGRIESKRSNDDPIGDNKNIVKSHHIPSPKPRHIKLACVSILIA